MAFLKHITPYAVAVLLLAVFYVPPPSGKTPYEYLLYVVQWPFPFLFASNVYSGHLSSVQKKPYEFLAFVVQWPFAFCEIEECYQDKDSLPNNFTIHGLWPTKKYPPWPRSKGRCFNLGEMDKEKPLQTNLSASWPNLKSNNNMIFWSYEYNKHGRCCHDIFCNQTKYFEEAHKMWLEHRVKEMFNDAGYKPGKSYEPVKLKEAVKNKTTKFPGLLCKNYTENNSIVKLLLEVAICYNDTGKEVIDCDSPHLDTCNGTDTILWK